MDAGTIRWLLKDKKVTKRNIFNAVAALTGWVSQLKIRGIRKKSGNVKSQGKFYFSLIFYLNFTDIIFRVNVKLRNQNKWLISQGEVMGHGILICNLASHPCSNKFVGGVNYNEKRFFRNYVQSNLCDGV